MTDVQMILEVLVAIVGIAAALVAAMRAIIGQVLKQQAAREIAERKTQQEFQGAMIRTQEKIALTLENHLSAMGQNLILLNKRADEDAELGMRAREYMAVTAQAVARLQTTFDAHDQAERELWQRLLDRQDRQA